MNHLTFRDAQVNQPWTVPYSADFKATADNVLLHLYGSHAVLHAAKSVGKLAAVFEELDHTGGVPGPVSANTIRNMAADLVTAALRLANLYDFDLESELRRRVHEKNGVAI